MAKSTRGNPMPDFPSTMDNPKVLRSSERKARKPRGSVPDHKIRGTLSPQSKGKLKKMFHKMLSDH